MSTTIGEKIKSARLRAGLSQGDVAKQVGVVWQAVQAWQRDRNTPRASLLSELSRVLNVPSNYFLDDTLPVLKEGESGETAPKQPSVSPSMPVAERLSGFLLEAARDGRLSPDTIELLDTLVRKLATFPPEAPGHKTD